MAFAWWGMDVPDLDLRRYKRQICLSDWGIEGQKRLKRSRVFVAGAGGLGCPVALNLALAGVGHIRICDFDTVETSNLNRQFLHSEQNIGVNKAESAREALLSVNPETDVEPISDEITIHNVDDLVADAEVVVDCLDNFRARHILNLCAVTKGIPMVHGAIWGLEGRVIFLHPPETPCLACIFSRAPSKENSPAMGAVSCAIGSMQALETIKYLTNMGSLLTGRMLVLDFSTMKFQELEVIEDPRCPVCSQLR
ncbi:MAG: HesA/MoeB/ThiF family protein [Thermodesulfobacteriota bacterium]|nr:HesA/MoeB/ThiF family protein [Thermodesulfobacteriota bacterium]